MRYLERVSLVVLGGLVVGLAARGMPAAQATETGIWTCYVVDRLPDVKDASDWKGAEATSKGLNATAPHAPSGTVLSVNYPTAQSFGSNRSDVGMLCVKQ